MKRQRGTGTGQTVLYRSPKRSIDKKLIYVTQTALAGSQAAANLITATFPATVVGLRWSLSAVQDGGTGVGSINWCIVKVPDGYNAGTMATSNAAEFYTPESMVLAFGVGNSNAATSGSIQFDGSTKTMRKIMGGDIISFLCVSSATNTYTIQGVIQFFTKS